VDFASYHLWSQFEPALGWEGTHCQMQRGWKSIHPPDRQESIATPLTATIWQKVGKLAQQGVYEFHQDPLLLKHPRGSERVADRLYLYYEIGTVRDRVMQILRQYQAQPWLLGRDLLQLNRGDEPLPQAIDIRVADDTFQLFAAFDCVVREVVQVSGSTSTNRDRIHIIDFKTGLADFDRRQADVYLLAGSYLYPDCELVASFYNLETMTSSELITATPDRLAEIAHKLAQIAHLHQQQLREYHSNPDCFDRLFPPHPGTHCRACSFNYRCNYAVGL
jgi:PD-(D/E)XK nuclease superfamily